MSKSIQEMSSAELEEFINQIPTKSACDRANIERLKQVLETKKFIEQQAVGAN